MSGLFSLGCSQALAQASPEAAPRMHLKVAGISGKITITGSAEAKEVSGAKEITKDGDKIRVSSRDEDLVLTVPASARVTVNTKSGDVKVRGVAGPVVIKSISASATVRAVGRGLTYRTISGDLDAGGINGPLKVRTVSGAVKAEGSLQGCEVRTVSGAIRLTGVQGLDVRSTSGTVVASGALPNKASAEVRSHSGDIEVTLKAPDGLKYSARSHSGEIEVTEPGKGVKSGEGKVEGSHGKAGASIQLRSFSGDIEIKITK